MADFNYRDQQTIYVYKKITITSVDPAAGIVDGTDANLQSYRVPINNFNPAYMAIPAVNEVWVIKKMPPNSWELYGRGEENQFSVTLDQMAEGDHRIDVTETLYISAKNVKFSQGSLSNVIDGNAINFPINFHAANPNNVNQDVLIIQADGDTYPEISLSQKVNEGWWSLDFGNGALPQDVSLYRHRPNTLTIKGNLEVTGSLTTSGASSKYVIPSSSSVRKFNPSSTTLTELANVVATILTDLGLKA